MRLKYLDYYVGRSVICDVDYYVIFSNYSEYGLYHIRSGGIIEMKYVLSLIEEIQYCFELDKY